MKHIFIVILLLAMWSQSGSAAAQVLVTDTPIPVIIPTQEAQSTGVTLLTPTPTFTATPEGSVLLEAAAAPGDINVRAQPDPASERLGSLEAGRRYVVRGQFYSWLQFEYENSPTGRAWVFESLVTVIGNRSEVPVLDPFAAPTVDPLQAAANEATASQLQTPGGIETATAEARTLLLPTAGAGTPQPDGSFIPTFTPPAEIVARRPTDLPAAGQTPTPQPGLVETLVTTTSSGSVPPILPIILLGGFGIIGLLVSLIRR